MPCCSLLCLTTPDLPSTSTSQSEQWNRTRIPGNKASSYRLIVSRINHSTAQCMCFILLSFNLFFRSLMFSHFSSIRNNISFYSFNNFFTSIRFRRYSILYTLWIRNKCSPCRVLKSSTEKDKLQEEEHPKRIAPPFIQYGWGYWDNFWAGDI